MPLKSIIVGGQNKIYNLHCMIPFVIHSRIIYSNRKEKSSLSMEGVVVAMKMGPTGPKGVALLGEVTILD